MKYTDFLNSTRFNYAQINQIRYGLEDGVDVSIYARPELDSDKMREIRLGLKAGIDISSYVKPELSFLEMNKIRQELMSAAQ